MKHLVCLPTLISIFSIDSNSLVLKKTDMESVFNLFQDSEENKKLVYVSTSTCLGLFVPFLRVFYVDVCFYAAPSQILFWFYCLDRCSCRSCSGNSFPMSIP